MTSMPPNAPPGLPAALRTDPDLWAITLPGETDQERRARYCAAADIAEEYWRMHAHTLPRQVDAWAEAAGLPPVTGWVTHRGAPLTDPSAARTAPLLTGMVRTPADVSAWAGRWAGPLDVAHGHTVTSTVLSLAPTVWAGVAVWARTATVGRWAA